MPWLQSRRGIENWFSELVSVVQVFARIAPGDVHLAGSQIHDHCRDGFFTVEWVGVIGGVVTNRVGVIDVVALDGL